MKSLHALLRNPLVLIVTGVLLSVLVVTAFAPAGVVEASATDDVCDAIGGRSPGANCTTDDPTVTDTFEAVINILSLLIGVIAVIMIIVGGIRYITSGGDANSAKGARDTIVYALVGLVIAAVAQAIVQFVLQRV